METYDVIKRLCEENGIAMTALEQKLGFGRGSIGKLKASSRSMTSERLQKVADFFGVSPEYLMTGEQPESYYVNPETADMAQELYVHLKPFRMFPNHSVYVRICRLNPCFFEQTHQLCALRQINNILQIVLQTTGNPLGSSIPRGLSKRRFLCR